MYNSPSWKQASDFYSGSRAQGRSRIAKIIALSGAVVAGLIVVGVIMRGGRVDLAEIPLIDADSSPVKFKPTGRGGMVVPNQDEMIFDPRSRQQDTSGQGRQTLSPETEAPRIDLLRAPTGNRTLQELPSVTTPAPQPSPPAQSSTSPTSSGKSSNVMQNSPSASAKPAPAESGRSASSTPQRRQ
jgi:hypothetical protein